MVNQQSDPRKNYCEFIILFTAWQNEEKDLLGDYSSHQEYYFLLAPKIQEQMKQCVMCQYIIKILMNYRNRLITCGRHR